ncbi:MAG TPA: MBL fold metallo-hydrolase [Longimicrobiales bacterium]|nr:MBL fold metallo-hydrolase [Longimicrobiales bacterium]
MPTGWVRAWDEEEAQSHLSSDKQRSAWRRDFRTTLHRDASASSAVLRELAWGDEVELPSGIRAGTWTRVAVDGEEGFVRSRHLVEVAWVDRGDGDDAWVAALRLANGGTVDLLWGDLVQIIRPSVSTCDVRVRGIRGTLDKARLRGEPLLEIYFIDVGQGDGVLVRMPSGRHMLIDGGLPRSLQMSGKNAADFVDWKFNRDYGHYRVDLDAVVASHCDYDHYGGLWDLVRADAMDDPEFDCIQVSVAEFYHAGLARWEERHGGGPPHRDGLGPNDEGWFVRLLGDRGDAEAAVVNGAPDELAGYWKAFIADLLRQNPDASVTRLGIQAESLDSGGTFPRVWPDEERAAIRVLSPVTRERTGAPALPDLGDLGKNTNGHSICLRVDHGGARILLTGDLNKGSHDWLMDSYGDRIAAFNCDVAKACHHGSADISHVFLERVNAAATVISSGDAEGFAHPRPEIVAASAVTGYVTVDREQDRLVTPLIYMTEIERSMEVGEVTHVTIDRYPGSGGGAEDGALFAMPRDAISDRALPEWTDQRAMAADAEHADELEDAAIARERARLDQANARQASVRTRAQVHFSAVHKLFSIRYGTLPLWGSRIMTRNHYGLVNVRTDGETILCATMREAGGGWTAHTFPARFGPRG